MIILPALDIYDTSKEAKSLVDWIGGKRLGKFINAIKKREFREWSPSMTPLVLLMWATWDDETLPKEREFWNGIVAKLERCYTLHTATNREIYDWELVLQTALEKK